MNSDPALGCPATCVFATGLQCKPEHLEQGKHDIAQRLRQRVTPIMRYAVQNDILESNPANDMAGALTTIPPMPHECLPDFLNRLSAYRRLLLTKIAVETCS